MKCRLLQIAIVLCFTLPICATAQTRYARVISANANLRDTPTVNSSIYQEITEGTLVKVLDQKLPWYVVRFRDHVGWMHGNTLEFVSATPGERVEQTIVPDYVPSTSPRRRSPRTSPSSGGYIPRSSGAASGYIRGPRGGCYYISGSGRKVYVDRSLCN